MGYGSELNFFLASALRGLILHFALASTPPPPCPHLLERNEEAMPDEPEPTTTLDDPAYAGVMSSPSDDVSSAGMIEAASVTAPEPPTTSPRTGTISSTHSTAAATGDVLSAAQHTSRQQRV